MAECCTSLYRSAQCQSARECDFSFPTIVAGLVTVGIILVVAMLCSPKHSLLLRQWRRWRMC
ncbi:hypothetical protein ACK8HJ_21875 [Vreelandella titanicae]|uniref:hypothetical protein n=1 Tax=Vreelandella titanicae TaxID=664683 RepID=UPI00034A6CA2|nr:hypothetical protein [Halomonas titanicae]NVE89760.1 hypothetical protein [Halomonas titanicae]